VQGTKNAGIVIISLKSYNGFNGLIRLIVFVHPIIKLLREILHLKIGKGYDIIYASK